jgi:hypothetical protein
VYQELVASAALSLPIVPGSTGPRSCAGGDAHEEDSSQLRTAVNRCSGLAGGGKRDSNGGSARDCARTQIRTNGNTWLPSVVSNVRTGDQLAFACDQERGLVLRLAALAQDIRREMMARRIFTSWNQTAAWLHQIVGVRAAA